MAPLLNIELSEREQLTATRTIVQAVASLMAANRIKKKQKDNENARFYVLGMRNTAISIGVNSLKTMFEGKYILDALEALARKRTLDEELIFE